MKLKIKLLNLFTIVSLIGMMISLCACPTHDEVVISANICCTSDLLDFVTPVVTIQGDNGQKGTFKLNKKDFKAVQPIIIKEDTTMICIASKIKTFEDVKAMKGNITVKYERNSYADTSKEIYVFFDDLNYSYAIPSDDMVYELPREFDIDKVKIVVKDRVEKYITDLCATERTISFDVK